MHPMIDMHNETSAMFGADPTSDQCNGIVPGSVQAKSMGYMFAFFSVFFFGTNFVPVRSL